MEQNITPDSFALQVDNTNMLYLKEAAKWAKFLAVLGFIFCAIFILVGLFAGSIFSSYLSEYEGSTSNDMVGVSSTVFTIIYILIALIYLFPCVYLFNFASRMQTALRNNDQVSLNSSFKNLKSCFKFWGIFTIIVLCIYAIAITFAIVAGFAFR